MVRRIAPWVFVTAWVIWAAWWYYAYTERVASAASAARWGFRLPGADVRPEIAWKQTLVFGVYVPAVLFAILLLAVYLSVPGGVKRGSPGARVLAGILWAAGTLVLFAAFVEWGDYLIGEGLAPAVLLGLLACALVGGGFFFWVGSREK